MRCSWTFSTQKSKQRTSNRASSEARMVLWMVSISCSGVRKEERCWHVVYLPYPRWRYRTYLCFPASLQTRGQHHAASYRILPSSLQEIHKLQLFPTRMSCLNVGVEVTKGLDLLGVVFYRVPHVKPMVPSGSGRHRGQRAIETGLGAKLHCGCRGY
jgi:hypothetical protein